ncbi:MAG TPA: alpha/beta hydrolase-fold protein [Pyrinomonadaceae bacterium]|nr:alpha/beta hydrolase-fold protein [Pyrinomonadaceae bacterium]
MKVLHEWIGFRTFRVLTLVLLSLWGNAFAQQPHTLTGDIRAHKSFHSNILKNDREVIVYLPSGYDASKRKRYSVFYMHDGQNLFDGATSFIPGQEWRVDETAERLIAAGKIEPLIIVGVYNTKDRVDEYTPAADAKYKLGGKADLYGRMLVEELKPFIDSQYRTKRDAKHTGLAGSSLGGLASLYLALKYPNVFGRAGVVSPSVWFAGKHILHYVESLPKKPNVRIWIDIGTKEGRTPEEAQQTVADARLLRDALVKKGWRLEKDLNYLEAEGAEHNESAWAARVESILTFLFPRKM